MHTHQFIHIEQVNRQPQGGGATLSSSFRLVDEFGARAGCIECGEIRVIWPDGNIVVEVKGKDVSSSL